MGRIWYRVLAILAAAGGIVWWFLTPARSDVHFSEGVNESTQQVQTTPSPAGLTFPYTLQDCDLVVEEVVSYSGQYMEDGSNDPVEDVTALVLYNPGERMVRFGAIALEQNGQQFYFFVYCLPPDSRCLVLEKSRKPYKEDTVTQCRMLSVRWEYQQLNTEKIHYVGFGETLTVVNHTDRRLRQISVWYKQYDHKMERYLGGVAYSAYVFRLNPQEQQVLTPEHYHAGNAKVVAVELENT